MIANIKTYIEKLTSIFREIDLYVNYTETDDREFRSRIAKALSDNHAGCEMEDFTALMDSIISSIQAATTDTQRELYCFSLLTPFDEYARQMPRFTPGHHVGESPYVEGVGSELMAYIELYHSRNKDQALTDDEVIGMVTEELLHEVKTYANMLDAAFAVCCIDLRALQERCGVILKEYADEDELAIRALQIELYVGNVPLAMGYLQRLPRYAQSSICYCTVEEHPQSPTAVRSLRDYLPPKLQNNESIAIFRRMIEADMIGCSANNLDWKGTKQLLAYFAQRMSDTFALSTKLDKDGNTTIAWKPFEDIFAINGLRNAKQNWMRVNTMFTPKGYNEVDALLCSDGKE